MAIRAPSELIRAPLVLKMTVRGTIVRSEVCKGKVHNKKSKKKLTSVSFMYVCVAENADLLVFFYFFFAPSP